MLAKSQLLTLTNKKGHRLTKTVPSGGGGNRTRVPRKIRTSFYVCSRLFDLTRQDVCRPAPGRLAENFI